jgi:nucleoside-diphosphate-sugar epimerase
VKVLGEEFDGIYNDQSPLNPQDPYAISKWKAEECLNLLSQKTSLEVVNLRPPLIYGPKVKANFLQLMKTLHRGIPLPLGAIKNNKRSLLYLGNLVDALEKLVQNSNVKNKTYLISDGEDFSTTEMAKLLSLSLQVPSRLLPFPPSLLRIAGSLFGKEAQVSRLLGSLQVDSSGIQKDLDWTPPHKTRSGFKETAQWLCNQPIG